MMRTALALMAVVLAGCLAPAGIATWGDAPALGRSWS